MTVTETRVQVMRKGSSKYTTISGATVKGTATGDVEVILPTTFVPRVGDTMRTVFKVVTP